MKTIGAVVLTLVAVVLAGATPAFAQSSPPGPSWLRVEGQFGKLGFVEDGNMDQLVLGGAARINLTKRLAIGPDVTYLRGPGSDRDELVLAIVHVDLGALPDSPSRAQPYVLAGGGFGRHRDEFVRNEGWLIDFGLGARVAVGDRWYVAPEFRFGWAAHLRFGVSVGWYAR